MRIPLSQRDRRFGVNLTSMIDVVFLLIIFFLVSSHLARQESNLPLPLPDAATGTSPPEVANRRITLNVRGDGSLEVGGRSVALEELASLLTEAIANKGADVEVRIRASRELPYRDAERLMLTCAKAGVWNVTYAVYPRTGATP